MAELNYIVGFIVFWLAFRYAFSKNMCLKYPILPRGKHMFVSQNMSFMLFSIATSMFFLGPLSLIKYAVWIFILVILSMVRYVPKSNSYMTIYWIFLFWCLYTLTYSQNMPQGVNMLLKYSLPIFYFYVGYNAICDKVDLILFMKYTTLVGVLYATFIGGVSSILLSPVYSFFVGSGLMVAYASLADFFSCIICIPIGLFVLTKEKKYLYAAAWMFLSTIAATVRTGLGGAVIAVSVFAFIIYKTKSIPYVVVLGLIFAGAVLFIPSVNEKMFGEEENTTDISLNAGGKNIAMNGREYIWDWALNKYYKGNEISGSGLGSALSGLKESREGALMHSDYVQMRCEIGDLGLGLFALFAFVAIIKTLKTTIRHSTKGLLTIIGGISIGSLAGMLFCMLFDNVVTYSQQAFVIPFILLGIFDRCIERKIE